MDLLDYKLHKIIVSNCEPMINILKGEEKKFLIDLKKYHQKQIDVFNSKTRSVLDKTKIEIGVWNGTVKKWIFGKYVNPYFRQLANTINNNININENSPKELFYEYDKQWECYFKKKEKHHSIFLNACNNISLDQELMDMYILIKRKSEWHHRNEIEQAIVDTIQTNVLIAFEKQNKKLINKYKL